MFARHHEVPDNFWPLQVIFISQLKFTNTFIYSVAIDENTI